MTTSQIVWLVVAIVVVLLVVGIAFWASQRRGAAKVERDRARAQEIRSDAEAQRLEMRESEVQAREAQVQAERARLEAEQADARAAESHQGLQMDQAQYEDRLRKADRIDPDVDHGSEDYDPSVPPQSTSPTDVPSESETRRI